MRLLSELTAFLLQRNRAPLACLQVVMFMTSTSCSFDPPHGMTHGPCIHGQQPKLLRLAAVFINPCCSCIQRLATSAILLWLTPCTFASTVR